MMELATSEPIIAQFYVKLREYIQAGDELSPQYLNMYQSLMVGDSTYHISDVKLLRVKLLKIAENIDLMSKKIQSLGVERLQEQSEGVAKPKNFVLQDQIRRASVNFIKETLVGLPSLPSDEELAKIQERRKMEIAMKIQEERRKQEEARIKFQNLQEKRKNEPNGSIRHSPSSSGSSSAGFNKSSVSYESGFVLSSSAQQREMVSVVTDDPMLQQIRIIQGYISQARQQHRYDEVNMLETNLKMLQEEFNKMNMEKQESEVTAAGGGYVSFNDNQNEATDRSESNPFNSDDTDDEYDASGKNPFAE